MIKKHWKETTNNKLDFSHMKKLVPQVEAVEKDIMDKYRIIIKQLRQRLNELRGNQ